MTSFAHTRSTFEKDLGRIYVLKFPYLAVKKWNRRIITESNIFANASYQLSEKNTPCFFDDYFDEKRGRKCHIFVDNSL